MKRSFTYFCFQLKQAKMLQQYEQQAEQAYQSQDYRKVRKKLVHPLSLIIKWPDLQWLMSILC